MDFLIIDDDRIFREATCLLIEDEGHYSEGAATLEVAHDALKMGKFDVVFLDVHLGNQNGLNFLPTILKLRPTQSVVMFSAQGTIKNAVQAIQLGAVDFLEKPFTREQFHTVLARLRRFNELGRKIEKLEEEVKETNARQPATLVDFETPAMKNVMEVLKRAAKSPASVLILGESGTGKSVAARALHEHSHLADKPFVTVSCPSLTKELLESTLFGHVRGAFTGALKDYWGKVKAADGGTLFLDEIGDLPLEIQPKLLRLLQEREYERVGETTIRRADVRIVAATNRDLKKRVEEGHFREDLYYRLNVIAVNMPPLRERPRDMLRFARHYLQHSSEQCVSAVKGITPAAEELLRRYPWPGNLRELHNTIERSVILATGTEIDVGDLPLELRLNSANAGPNGTELRVGSMVTLQQLEDQHICRVLEGCPNLNEAAEILGINQATLYRKRIRLGIKNRSPDTAPSDSPPDGSAGR